MNQDAVTIGKLQICKLGCEVLYPERFEENSNTYSYRRMVRGVDRRDGRKVISNS